MSSQKVDNYRLNAYQVETQVHDSLQRQVMMVANQVIPNAILALAPGTYDEIQVSYVSSGDGIGDIQTVTYYSSSVSQRVVTLAYDSSNRVTSLTTSGTPTVNDAILTEGGDTLITEGGDTLITEA